MDCCRICLATNELSEIFGREEIASYISTIACVDISQNDGLPQYICILCKHELDISINFKNKCENTFKMLKEQHNNKLEVKGDIILNLLSGHKVLDDKLPQQARESILNTIKNSINNDVKLVGFGDRIKDKTRDEKYLKESDQKENNGIKEFDDQMIDVDDQTTTVTDVDDQMTDLTESDIEIAESLSIRYQDLMCAKCNVCFVNEHHLFDHLKKIHSKTMEQCQICLQYFPTRQLLKDHLSSKHDISDENENLEKRCKMCNKIFGLQSGLNSHLCSIPDQTVYGCEICQLYFKFETDLGNHIKYIHQQVKFTCEECNESFAFFDLYSKHLKEHSNSYRNINHIELLCSECDKCFLSNEAWNEHINLCHPQDEDGTEKSYKCTHCHKVFAKSAHLSAHERIHKGTKPHVCAICQMSFYRKNALERHLLRHDDFIKCTRKETYVT